jgi:hypothetical protein
MPIELRIGDWYIVAGQGPLQVSQIPAPPLKTTVTMRSPGGYVYWAGVNEIVRPVYREYLSVFERDRAVRGYDNEGFGQIWEWLDHAQQQEVRLP